MLLGVNKKTKQKHTSNSFITWGKMMPKFINPKDAQGAVKPQLWLNPPSALRAMAQAMESGAEKYGAYNWRENEVREDVYISAALRHIAAYQDGERADPDSGAHPLGHAMASLAILIDGETNV